MKRILFAAFIVGIFAVSVMAADFTPTLMKMSAPASVQYDFDGAALKLNVTVTGTPALALFCVGTKDQGAAIGKVRNGFLGWHYVNQIDTLMYVSPGTPLDVGVNEITWDGKDENGNMVPAGEYYYYVWGFDNVNPKTIVTKNMPFRWNENAIIQIRNESGTPLAKPIIWEGGQRTKTTNSARIDCTHRKFTIGGDPEDATLVETTKLLAAADLGSLALDPKDYTLFWKADGIDNGNVEIRKFKWVPNGDAVLQTAWGDEGKCAFALPGNVPSSELHMPITTVEGGSHIFVSKHDYITGAPETELIYFNMETGEEDTRIDISDFWVDLDDGAKGGQSGGGPSDTIDFGAATIGGPLAGLLHLSCHGSCVNQTLDPYRFGEVGGDCLDVTLWENDNGDYVGDHNYETDSVRPWVCNDYNPGPYKYWTASDKYGFCWFPSYNLGSTSFGLYAVDGTGVGQFAVAGETAANKFGHRVLQYGSAYDGMYMDGNATGQGAIWCYIAMDSVRGVISSSPVAVEEGPAAFAVAQNSPNPFNPTTTIGFSIPEAGTVSVDVFNVAGQKVATVANEFMSAGNHSVVFNASDLSAGVYFYTVKAGSFAKTMKMTLLK